MRHLLSIPLAALLLGACAGGPGHYGPAPGSTIPVTPNPPPQNVGPLARTVTYTCEDLTTVVLTEGSSSARAMTNSGLELGLARQPDAYGFTYGGGTHEFRGRGGEASWHVNGKIFRCRVK